MSYREFLKSYQRDNNISSFFGSDKQQFLADWKEAKEAKTRFGEKIVTQPMEIAEPSPNITIAPPKPKITAAETVLTNPDLLKQIGSFTNARHSTMVNAIKIKLTPDTDKKKLEKFLVRKYKNIPTVSRYFMEEMVNDKIIQFLDKWIALSDIYRTVEKKAEKLYGNDKKKYEYFMTQEVYRGYDFFDVMAMAINETALKFIQDAEKKGLLIVEYKFFKKIADLGGGYQIVRPKQKKIKLN